MSFIWRNAVGGEKDIQEMDSLYIYRCLRMMFNHKVPPRYQFGMSKRYESIVKWDDAYVALATTEMLKELSERTDLTTEITSGLDHMSKIAQDLLKEEEDLERVLGLPKQW